MIDKAKVLEIAQEGETVKLRELPIGCAFKLVGGDETFHRVPYQVAAPIDILSPVALEGIEADWDDEDGEDMTFDEWAHRRVSWNIEDPPHFLDWETECVPVVSSNGKLCTAPSILTCVVLPPLKGRLFKS